MEIKDTYRTIDNPTEEILFKDKNSKFYGYAFPINTTDEIKIHIEKLKKQHVGAVHFCYAYQIGTEKVEFRANDDGEPSNSAGIPIYGQIQSYGLTNLLIVVVRFFGGTKLGVGGLITAYKTTAQLVIGKATIIEKTINIKYKITLDYKNINKVMRIIKEKQLDIYTQKMEDNCEIIIVTRKKNAQRIFEMFDSLFEISISNLD